MCFKLSNVNAAGHDASTLFQRLGGIPSKFLMIIGFNKSRQRGRAVYMGGAWKEAESRWHERLATRQLVYLSRSRRHDAVAAPHLSRDLRASWRSSPLCNFPWAKIEPVTWLPSLAPTRITRASTIITMFSQYIYFWTLWLTCSTEVNNETLRKRFDQGIETSYYQGASEKSRETDKVNGRRDDVTRASCLYKVSQEKARTPFGRHKRRCSPSLEESKNIYKRPEQR